ncbi:MAG TPA: hypothetical protein VNO26_07615 [Candidatus Limnocylindria bacterium]|nr:hypothetical protein [Candidatus Limnocylindria bacterium]
MTGRRAPALWNLFGYLAVFALVTRAWWSTAVDAVPPGNDPRDARLIVWILGWVTQALSQAPAAVFDAPIYYPAPDQLSGSEHFFAAQLVFAPLYRATGNAVLAANLVALLSYPAAAFAMERLLAAHGLGRGAAWFGGLAFALGIYRVPASLHVLQYPMLFLPLVVLRLRRAREHPGPRAAALLTVCLLAGLFASYYLATLLALAVAIWGVLELWQAGPRRWRLLALVAVAAAVSGVALAWVSLPYFDRLAAEQPNPPDDRFWSAVARTLFGDGVRDPVLIGLAALAAGGLVAGVRRGTGRRGLAVAAAASVAVGIVLLVCGWPSPIEPWLGFFRHRTRYLLLSSFGFNVLVALGYEALRARLTSRIAGAVLLAALGGALVWARAGALALPSDPVLAESRDREQYRQLAALVRKHGPGPLLELPYVSTPLVDRAPEQMVGQLRHGMPLVNGFTGYRPPHLPLLASLIGALPAPAALDDLIDMTHLRWIVIRPADEWDDPVARQRLLDGLGRYHGRGPRWRIGSWYVQRLDRVPAHAEWFEAIAEGARPGQSALGAALAPIAEADARAIVSAEPPGLVVARWFVGVKASVENRGRTPWPAWTSRGWSAPGLVHWRVRWRRADAAAPWGPPHTMALRRDVPAGETLVQSLPVPTPPEPGDYELEIAVEQQDGARFSAAGNRTAILRLTVLPPRY